MALKLDKIDLSIIAQLQENARMSDKEISRKIHLSPNAVTTRIKRLEDEGFIQRYTTVLNKSMMNRNLECLTGINLTHNNYQTVTSFLKDVVTIPEVYHIYHINSTFDFILKVLATDIHEYHQLLNNKLSTLNCVSSTTSFVVFNEIVCSHILDLSHLYKEFD